MVHLSIPIPNILGKVIFLSYHLLVFHPVLAVGGVLEKVSPTHYAPQKYQDLMWRVTVDDIDISGRLNHPPEKKKQVNSFEDLNN